jgi:hypothetical protein
MQAIDILIAKQNHPLVLYYSFHLPQWKTNQRWHKKPEARASALLNSLS